MTTRTIIAGALACAVCAACQHDGSTAHGESGLEAGSRPNILLIVADDLGYLDLGVFGSEIETPNIDALAASGVILTNFYVSVSCQPTRAMLLSGSDNHVAGVGAQGRVVEGHPGYQNRLNERVASVAERLNALDYDTYMVGKWHLGEEPGQTPADRGFARSFVLLQGGAGHFEDMLPYGANVSATYQDDGVTLDALPEGFYSTIDYTDAIIEKIDADLDDERPFFAFVSYTAPHWPIHALDEDMARVRGRYDEGYDVIRERRFEAWRDAGFAPPGSAHPRLPAGLTPWAELSPQRQAIEARTMEAYAAMVERLDTEIGRLLSHLRERGELENTLVVFMADNGAEATSNEGDFLGDYRDRFDNSLDNIGRINSYRLIGPGWGEAGAASFYLSKSAMADGGVHVPAIVSAPGLGLEPGRNDAVIAAFDLAPTFVELAGGSNSAISVNGTERLPMSGRSFAAALRDEPRTARGPDQAVAFEHGGQRAVRRGDWKALWLTPPRGPEGWALYDLAADPGERNDLSDERPQLLAELVAYWGAYARNNDVIVEEEYWDVYAVDTDVDEGDD